MIQYSGTIRLNVGVMTFLIGIEKGSLAVAEFEMPDLHLEHP